MDCNCCDWHESDLGWILKTVKKFDESYKNDLDELEEKLKEYIDSGDSALKGQIQGVESRFQDYVIIFKNELNNRITFEISNLQNELNWGIDYLERKINNLVYNPLVINPATHSVDTLQNVLNMLYRSIYIFGLTAGEYASLSLTAEEYSRLELTAEEYAYWSQLKIGWQAYIKRLTYMVHPENGLWVPIVQVVNWLASLHQTDCLTAGEYEIVDLTAEEYEALNINATQYSWDSRNLVKKEVTS